MVNQSAIFVDAGFLLAVGGTHVAGTSLRSAFRVDYEKLIQGILKRTSEHSGLNVLRVYWYDASKDALFTDEHKSIGLLPDVKVRLGRISFNGDQKGVDLKLGLDLVGVARNRAASVAFLMSGDDDLAEAVEEAQDLGMKVVLVGLDNPNHRLGVTSVAEHLALRVDSIITLPTALIEECFTKVIAEAPRPVPPLTVPPLAVPPQTIPRTPAPGPRPSDLAARPGPARPYAQPLPAFTGLRPTSFTAQAARARPFCRPKTAHWTSQMTSARAWPPAGTGPSLKVSSTNSWPTGPSCPPTSTVSC